MDSIVSSAKSSQSPRKLSLNEQRETAEELKSVLSETYSMDQSSTYKNHRPGDEDRSKYRNFRKEFLTSAPIIEKSIERLQKSIESRGQSLKAISEFNEEAASQLYLGEMGVSVPGSQDGAAHRGEALYRA